MIPTEGGMRGVCGRRGAAAPRGTAKAARGRRLTPSSSSSARIRSRTPTERTAAHGRRVTAKIDDRESFSFDHARGWSGRGRRAGYPVAARKRPAPGESLGPGRFIACLTRILARARITDHPLDRLSLSRILRRVSPSRMRIASPVVSPCTPHVWKAVITVRIHRRWPTVKVIRVISRRST